MFLNTKRKKKNIFLQFIKYILYFVLFSVFLLFILLFLNFINIKIAYEKAQSGKKNLEYSLTLIKDKNLKSALDFSLISQEDFREALEHVEKIKKNIIINKITYLDKQLGDVYYLFSVADLLSQSFSEGIKFNISINNIINSETNFNNLSIRKKEELIKRIYESGPELNGLKANLDLALLTINNISYKGFIKIFKNKIEDLKIKIQSVDELLKSAVPMSELLPFVLGYPQKTSFLIVLQNSDELRPTGGFIGTYGILEIEHGEILRFDTHDIYHMDMPVKDKINIKPPKALKDYLGVDKWYMRDANWSPDWGKSSQKIEWFFKKEDKLLSPKNQINNFQGDFDGIVAINPKLIIDLLKVVGPITIEGEEYNQNNFTDLLQYKVEKGYELLGTPSWHRKEVIGKIAEEIKMRIFNFNASNLYKLVEIFNSNLEEKNILINFKEKNLDSIIRENGWDGRIKNVKSDYLMIVDANMAAYKTDRVIDRRIEYKLNEKEDNFISNLKIFYKHNGQFDWKTTRYRTYTRIYVPLGSKLIKAGGFSQDGEIEVYNEFNKTVFAGFISIEPGKIANIYISYELPNNIKNSNNKKHYSLYIQKQPGTKTKELNVTFNFNKDISSYYPTGFYASQYNNQVNWESNLLTDREFIVNF